VTRTRLHRARRAGTAGALIAVTAALTAACSPASSPEATAADRTVTAPSSTPAVSASTVPASPVVTPPDVAPGTPGTPRGKPAPPPPVEQSPAAADEVAGSFAAASFTYDTAIDVSPHDAQVRAAAYATPTYARTLRAPVPSTGDAQFTDLAAHHGFTTVALAPNADDGRPPDQLRSAARSVTVTPTGHGDNGWTQPLPPRVMYVLLTRDGPTSPWQVDQVSFGSVPTSGAGL
jgi:hypothetical protein